jgi:hypothetical protein
MQDPLIKRPSDWEGTDWKTISTLGRYTAWACAEYQVSVACEASLSELSAKDTMSGMEWNRLSLLVNRSKWSLKTHFISLF